MVSRLFGLVALLVSLSISALGTAFGADKDKSAFLGVVPDEVTSDIAEGYGVRPGEGVLVAGVSSESPAEKIGLRENDIIISLNSASITGPEELRNKIAKMEPGSTVELVYVRGGKQKTVSVKLESREDREFGFFGPDFMKDAQRKHEMKDKAPRARTFVWHGDDEEHEKIAFAGIVTQSLSEGLAAYFKVEKGALIAEVVEDSPAAKGGLKAGDVLVKIGDEDIEDEGDVREAIHDYEPGDKVDFTVMREGQQITLNITLGEQEDDLGQIHIELDKELQALGELPDFTPAPEDMQRLQELEEKLQNLDIRIEGLDPMDIRIEQLPDLPRTHIEKYRIGPVRNDERGWQRHWHRMQDIVRTELNELRDDFARLRDELVELGQELMGRTA